MPSRAGLRLAAAESQARMEAVRDHPRVVMLPTSPRGAVRSVSAALWVQRRHSLVRALRPVCAARLRRALQALAYPMKGYMRGNSAITAT